MSPSRPAASRWTAVRTSVAGRDTLSYGVHTAQQPPEFAEQEPVSAVTWHGPLWLATFLLQAHTASPSVPGTLSPQTANDFTVGPAIPGTPCTPCAPCG